MEGIEAARSVAASMAGEDQIHVQQTHLYSSLDRQMETSGSDETDEMSSKVVRVESTKEEEESSLGVCVLEIFCF